MEFERIELPSFGTLRAQWRQVLESNDFLPDELPTPLLDHAETIVRERSDKNYGIYVLRDSEGTYHCLCHVNWASLPRSNGVTQRVVWLQLSPIYDIGIKTDDETWHLLALLVKRCVDLALTNDRAQHVKICLNSADHRIARGMAEQMRKEGLDASVGGTWLQIKNLVRLGGSLSTVETSA